MRKYLAQRLLIAVPTLLGVTLLIFIAMRVLPGDPLAAISGEGGEATSSARSSSRPREPAWGWIGRTSFSTWTG